MGRGLLALALLALSLPVAPAAAQESVAVLGAQSLEGDDEFARTLTRALRLATQRHTGFRISPREVTLGQVLLAMDCETPTLECLGQVAEGLDVDLVLYTQVQRVGTDESFTFEVTVNLYSRADEDIRGVAREQHPSDETEQQDLEVPARRWVATITNQPRPGRLAIAVSAPSARVTVEGRTPTNRTGGVFYFENLPPGDHRVRVEAPGYATLELPVSIRAFELTEERIELQVTGGGGGVGAGALVGVGLLVVGAGLLGGWVYTLVRIDDLNGNPDLLAYRAVVGEAEAQGAVITGDVCQNANLGNNFDLIEAGDPILQRTREVCSEANSLEALQWVFLGTGVAALGAGTFLLLRDLLGGGDGGETADLELRLLPSLGPTHAHLGAQLSF